MQSFKLALVTIAAYAMRSVMQYLPGYRLRLFCWEHIIRPYIAWRPITLEAVTKYNTRMRLLLSDLVQQYVFFFGQWEPAISNYIASALREGDTFIDVGANVGYYSLLAARIVGKSGRVFAVEPSPTIFSTLRNNVYLNMADNILLHNCAASDRAGEVRVFLHHQDNYGQTTIIEDRCEPGTVSLEAIVRAFPLPVLVPKEDLLRAKFIKIDVEGAEWRVISGFSELLSQFSDRTEIIVETNAASLRAMGTSIDDLLLLFEAAGFLPWVIPNLYDAGFYLKRSRIEPERLTGSHHGVTDLLFRRKQL